MSEFKVGDKVIFMEVDESNESYDNRHFSVGKEYTIVTRDDRLWPNYIEVIGNEGRIALARKDQVKLVQEEEMQEEDQVEKVSKYTVEEVFQSIDDISDCFTPWSEIDEIKWRLLRCKEDPEYKEYLRLKSKFE
jgi:hypothetical protein